MKFMTLGIDNNNEYFKNINIIFFLSMLIMKNEKEEQYK